MVKPSVRLSDSILHGSRLGLDNSPLCMLGSEPCLWTAFVSMKSHHLSIMASSMNRLKKSSAVASAFKLLVGPVLECLSQDLDFFSKKELLKFFRELFSKERSYPSTTKIAQRGAQMGLKFVSILL